MQTATDNATAENVVEHDYDCTCAWCLAETDQLKNQQEGDSHGICEYHAEQVYAAWRAKRAS